MPSSCGSIDVQSQVEASLQRFANSSELIVEVRVEEGMCQVKSQTFSSAFVIVA